jgi:hypothetical protein
MSSTLSALDHQRIDRVVSLTRAIDAVNGQKVTVMLDAHESFCLYLKWAGKKSWINSKKMSKTVQKKLNFQNIQFLFFLKIFLFFFVEWTGLQFALKLFYVHRNENGHIAAFYCFLKEWRNGEANIVVVVESEIKNRPKKCTQRHTKRKKRGNMMLQVILFEK